MVVSLEQVRHHVLVANSIHVDMMISNKQIMFIGRFREQHNPHSLTIFNVEDVLGVGAILLDFGVISDPPLPKVKD